MYLVLVAREPGLSAQAGRARMRLSGVRGARRAFLKFYLTLGGSENRKKERKGEEGGRGPGRDLSDSRKFLRFQLFLDRGSGLPFSTYLNRKIFKKTLDMIFKNFLEKIKIQVLLRRGGL